MQTYLRAYVMDYVLHITEFTSYDIYYISSNIQYGILHDIYTYYINVYHRILA